MGRTRAGSSATTRLSFVAMAALFVFAAAVQINDPDPWLWVALYIAAASVSLAALWRPSQAVPAMLVAAIAILWAATLVPAAARTSLPDLFQSWEMMSVEMEEGRELAGLTLVAAWTGYLALRARTR
jgi:hypothetical protein